MAEIHRKRKIIGLLRKIGNNPRDLRVAFEAIKLVCKLEGWLKDPEPLPPDDMVSISTLKDLVSKLEQSETDEPAKKGRPLKTD
jgi:hypothetical protein